MIQVNLDLSDFPEKDSIAAIAYIDGCDRACPSCHNPILQKKQYGDTDTALIVDNIRRYLDDRGLAKLVLSGGDPLYTDNLPLTRSIIDALKGIDICI